MVTSSLCHTVMTSALCANLEGNALGNDPSQNSLLATGGSTFLAERTEPAPDLVLRHYSGNKDIPQNEPLNAVLRTAYNFHRCLILKTLGCGGDFGRKLATSASAIDLALPWPTA